MGGCLFSFATGCSFVWKRKNWHFRIDFMGKRIFNRKDCDGGYEIVKWWRYIAFGGVLMACPSTATLLLAVFDRPAVYGFSGTGDSLTILDFYGIVVTICHWLCGKNVSSTFLVSRSCCVGQIWSFTLFIFIWVNWTMSIWATRKCFPVWGGEWTDMVVLHVSDERNT